MLHHVPNHYAPYYYHSYSILSKLAFWHVYFTSFSYRFLVSRHYSEDIYTTVNVKPLAHSTRILLRR